MLPSVRPGVWLKTNTASIDPPDSLPDSPDRVAAARIRRGGTLLERFAAAGVKYPPAQVFIRVFKYEGELELWATDAPEGRARFRRVYIYLVLRASGRLGPKRQEGDLQVPEGIYRIDRFNPRSLFHLSLGLDYPNASDRLLAADRDHPGSDVFIHGGCDSVGCLAMGDPASEEIFLAAWDAKQGGQQVVSVHIFPCRMEARNRAEVLAPSCQGDPATEIFWRGLQEGYDSFERTHQVPDVQVREDGSYAISRS